MNEEGVFDDNELSQFIDQHRELVKEALEIRKTKGFFDFGPRPEELIGETSMKAEFLETNIYYYYGEVNDEQRIHGKGI